MNLILALLLQMDEVGKKPKIHTPGAEGDFSRIMIVIFIATLAVAATCAIYMVLRGAGGANKAHNEKHQTDDK